MSIYQSMSKWFAALDGEDRDIVIDSSLDEMKATDEEFMDDITGARWSDLDADEKTRIVRWYHGMRKGLSEPKVYAADELDMSEFFKNGLGGASGEAVKIESDSDIPQLCKVVKPIPKKQSKSTKPTNVVKQITYELLNKDKLKQLLQSTKWATPLICNFLKSVGKEDHCEENAIEYMWSILTELYKRSDEEGYLTTLYQYSRKAETGDNPGRLYAQHGLSMQSIHRIIRHTIALGLNIDIDMKNAHPTIIKGLCDEHEVECVCLTEYIEDRETVLKRVCKELNCDRSDAKVQVLRVINGGGKATKSKTLKKLFNELRTIAEEFAGNADEPGISYKYHDQCSEPSADKKFRAALENRMMINLVNEIENDILHDVAGYFCDLGLNVGTLQFDGLFIMTTPDTHDVSVAKIEAEFKNLTKMIMKKYHISMEFETKPMTEGLNMSACILDTEESGSYCLDFMVKKLQSIDVYDSYTFNDFKREIQNRVFPNRESMIKFCKENMCKFMVQASVQGIFVSKIRSKYDPYIIESKFVKQANQTNFKFLNKKGETEQYQLGHIINEGCIPCYVGVNYFPNGDTPLDFYNLWPGFQAKQVKHVDENKFSFITYILKNLWCCGDEMAYKWVLAWLRRTVAEPGSCNGTAIFVAGAQGAGKGFFTDFFCKWVCGNYTGRSFNGLSELLKDHQIIHAGKRFINIDEVSDDPKNFISDYNKLKRFITAEDLNINEKNINPTTVPYFANVILSTNYFDALHIEDVGDDRIADRRYTCLKVSSDKVENTKENTAWWDAAAKASHNQECADHFYSYLMSLDPNELPNPRRTITTNYKRELLEQNRSTPGQFLRELIIYNYQSDTKIVGIAATKLYLAYKSWCSAASEEPWTVQKFGRIASKYLIRQKNRIATCYALPETLDGLPLSDIIVKYDAEDLDNLVHKFKNYML